MSWLDFHFIRPWLLVALVPAGFLFMRVWRSKLSQGVWSSVCDEALLPYLLQNKAAKPHHSLLLIAFIATLLAIFAAAGPTWQRLPAPVFRNASALVVALDLSVSMNAQDIKPSRLIRARYKIADLLKQRKDGQTALLVYSGAAFTVTPLTDDIQTITSQLSALTTEMMPVSGSNAQSAIEKAVTLFKQAGLQKGEIILVTDGLSSGSLASLVTALDTYHLSVLGVGSAEGAPIPEVNGGFVKDQQGGIVIAKLMVDSLAELAQAGNGIYQAITADDGDVRNLLATLNQRVDQEDKGNGNVMLELWSDKGPWLLILVLPLAALSFRRGVLFWLFCLALPFPDTSYAFEWVDLWQTPDQQAQQQYQQKHFSEAAKQFSDPQWQAAAHYQASEYDQAAAAYNSAPLAGDSDYFYNQGNALAKSGQLEAAIKAYDQALVMNPNNADAQYNKHEVAKALEEKKQEQKNQHAQQGENKNSENNSSDKGEPKETGDSNDQKPETKPEHSSADAPDQENKGKDKQEADKQNVDAKKAQGNQTKASPSQPQAVQEADKMPENTTPAVESTESSEQQLANEQWLKRIPDDPAGLLKRKFKYQYSQQGQQSIGNPEDW